MKETLIQFILMTIAVTIFTGYYMLSSIFRVIQYNPYSSLDNYIVNNPIQSWITAIMLLLFMGYILYNEFIEDLI